MRRAADVPTTGSRRRLDDRRDVVGTVAATSRRGTLDAARAAIAEWLDVPPDLFDVKK